MINVFKHTVIAPIAAQILVMLRLLELLEERDTPRTSHAETPTSLRPSTAIEDFFEPKSWMSCFKISIFERYEHKFHVTSSSVTAALESLYFKRVASSFSEISVIHAFNKGLNVKMAKWSAPVLYTLKQDNIRKQVLRNSPIPSQRTQKKFSRVWSRTISYANIS